MLWRPSDSHPGGLTSLAVERALAGVDGAALRYGVGIVLQCLSAEKQRIVLDILLKAAQEMARAKEKV